MAKVTGKTDTADPLVPTKTPFGYNVGVNYESWEVGRTGYSIKADLDQIYEDFRLIRTYHDAGFDTTPVIDDTFGFRRACSKKSSNVVPARRCS